MKRTALVSALFFAFSILAFFACKDQLNNDLQSDTSNISVEIDPAISGLINVENGMLTFENEYDLKKVYEYITDDYSRGAFLKQLPGFVSAASVFNQISEQEVNEDQVKNFQTIAYWKKEGDEAQLEPVISNPIYAMLYNQNAMMKVGNKIVQHTIEGLISFDVALLPSYPNLTPAQYHLAPHPVSANTEATDRGTCSTVYAYQNGNQYRKVTGRADAEWQMYGDPLTGNYYYALTGWYGLETKNYKRGLFGAWYLNKADIIGVTVSGLSYSTTNENTYLRRQFGCCATGTVHFVTDSGSSGSCITN